MRNDKIDDEGNEINLNFGGNDYIKVNSITIRNYNVFLDGEIGDSSEYRELRHILNTATENDFVTMYINSVGGNLYTALGIIEAMKRSQAKIHSIVEGECMSAATIILLNSDEISICDSAALMIHSAHYGAIGSTNNVKGQADFVAKMWKELEKKTYTAFLTDKEIDSVSAGAEIYLNASDTKKRLKKWAEWKNNHKVKLKTEE